MNGLPVSLLVDSSTYAVKALGTVELHHELEMEASSLLAPLELTAYILAVAAFETSPHPLIVVRILLATVQSGYPRPYLNNWCPRHFIMYQA